MKESEAIIVRRLFVVMAISLMAVVVAAANISLSLRVGRLAEWPMYDDVTYLLDGYSRLKFSSISSIWDACLSFWESPPHAPLSTLTAMLGFAFIGPFVVAPYIANGWILFLYIGAIYLISRRRLAPLPSLITAAIFSFAPASHAIVSEFRPDMAAGLLIALAVFLLLHVPFEKASLACRVGVAAFAVFASCAKPSAVVVAFPVIGISTLMAFMLSLRELRSVKTALSRFLLPACIFLMLFASVAAIWGPMTVGYIYQALVTNADVWRTPGDTLFHWTFHSYGFGGRQALGPFITAGLLFIIGDIVLTLKEKAPWDRFTMSALSYYCVLIFIYVGMANSGEKTVFQGSFFYFPFLIASALAASRIFGKIETSSTGRNAGTAILSSILAVSIIILPIATGYTVTNAYSGATAVKDSVLREVGLVIDARRQNQCTQRLIKFAALGPDPVSAEGLQLAAAMALSESIAVVNPVLERSADAIFTQIADADLVLVPSSADMKDVSRLPSFIFTPEIVARLENSGTWQKIPMPITAGARSTLYIRQGC